VTDDPGDVDIWNLMLGRLSLVGEFLGAVSEGVGQLREGVLGGSFELSLVRGT